MGESVGSVTNELLFLSITCVLQIDLKRSLYVIFKMRKRRRGRRV